MALAAGISQPPITLVVTAPVSPSEFPPIIGRFLAVPIETIGGWPLDLRLTADNGQLLGVGTVVTPFPFPAYDQRGFLVFKDPNNCLSFTLNSPCPTPDETYLEFTATDEKPGVPTLSGNPERLAHLTEEGGGGRPQLFGFDFPSKSNTAPFQIGPDVGGGREHRCAPHPVYFGGGAICQVDSDCPEGQTCQLFTDGYGFGADDALPGLVVLADRGVGVVLDQTPGSPPAPRSPRQARNLAGLLNSVSWELDDAIRHTSVNAHMTVPNGLVGPTIFADICVGVPNPNAVCEGSALPIVQLDGGPQQSRCIGCQEFRDYLSSLITTVRVFVVNQTAPDLLTDLNGDGVVDAKDAALAGYTLLSNAVTVQFKVFHQEGEFPDVFFDFDGNGSGGVPVAPAAGGTITKPPR